MSYPPDLGNVFASDVHRRVMANCPNPDEAPLTAEGLAEERIAKDDHLHVYEGDLSTLLDALGLEDLETVSLGHYITATELLDVLEDLEADGHVKQLKDGWKNTPDGFKALTGPPAEEN